MTPSFDGLELKKSTKSVKDTFVLTIKGDENDADYITAVTEFSYTELKKYLNLLSKIGNEITSIAEQSRDNYKPSELEQNQIYTVCPYSEYGIHSLEIDSFVYYDKDGEPWDVSFDPEFKI